jgi:hypothetical protein
MGFIKSEYGTLSGTALGSLQRIDFGGGLDRGLFYVGSQVAVSQFPFLGGIGSGKAIFPTVEVLASIATFTRFDYGMARSSVKRTTLGAHEGTGNAGFYG